MITGLTRSGRNLKKEKEKEKKVLEINEAGASDDQLIKLVWPYLQFKTAQNGQKNDLQPRNRKISKFW